jgi:hypothetical protein
LTFGTSITVLLVRGRLQINFNQIGYGALVDNLHHAFERDEVLVEVAPALTEACDLRKAFEAEGTIKGKKVR